VSWWIDAVAGPLVGGWMGLAFVASATHLLPAVGPGDPIAHARQRVSLGRAAAARLVLANAGVALLAVGLPLRIAPLAVGGAIAVAVALGGTAVLLAAAVRVGFRGVPLS
jgi:hypothetical protein